MKFDIAIMNPPYSGANPGDGLYVQFVNKCLKNVNGILVSITPDIAFVGHQAGSIAKKHIKELRDFINLYNVEIEEVNNIFDAYIKSGLCISTFNMHKEKGIIVINNGSIAKYENQKDIRIYFDNKFLIDFENNIKKFIVNSDNIENHLKLTSSYGGFSKAKLKELHPDKDKLYVYVLKPNASYPYVIYNNKNALNTVKQFDENDQKISCGYINFNKDEYENAVNCLNYLKTDFVRLCVKIANISDIGSVNRYQIIPWLDFSKSYSEEELFNMIGMEYNKEEIDKILSE